CRGRYQQDASSLDCNYLRANSTAPRYISGLGQFVGSIVPVQMGNLTIALLIRVCHPIIVVECEVTIRPGVNHQMGNTLLIVCALDGTSEGYNRTLAHEEGDRIDRS